jgi:hypothetical protein
VDKIIQHVKNIVPNEKCNPIKVLTLRSVENKTSKSPSAEATRRMKLIQALNDTI